MSYILDALKKAQAERELGRVPPLQGSASAIAGHAPAATRAALPRWLWPAVAALLLVVAAAAWWLRPAPQSQAQPAAFTTQAPTPAKTAAPPAPIEQAAPQVAAAPPVLPPALPPPPVTPVPAPVPAPAPPAASEAVIALEALDPATRARLPPLVPGGAIHSAERNQRMVILDGQVLREGDALTSDVSVIAIEPQGVVLRLGDRLGNQRVRIRP